MPEQANTYREGSPYLVESDEAGFDTVQAGQITNNGAPVGLPDSISYPYTRLAVATANTLVSDSAVVAPVDTSGATVTITLASSVLADGAWLLVNDEGGNAGTNAITIDTEGTETIDGGASVSISSNYGSLLLYSDGANWFTAGSTGGGGTL